jgi:hypothetical protein
MARLTTLGNIQALSGLKAISGPGGLIFVNPAPGQLGTLCQGTMTGPGTFRLDVNLVKRIQINGRMRTALTTLKIAVVVPMPSARTRIATKVKAGFFRSVRRA